jgi:hypothetical protein
VPAHASRMGAGGFGHEGGAAAGLGLPPLEGGGGSGDCAAGSSGPIWTRWRSAAARRWSRAASALVGVTAAWNRGGSRPRAVLLCLLAAWGSAGHGGSLRPTVVPASGRRWSP